MVRALVKRLPTGTLQDVVVLGGVSFFKAGGVLAEELVVGGLLSGGGRGGGPSGAAGHGSAGSSQLELGAAATHALLEPMRSRKMLPELLKGGTFGTAFGLGLYFAKAVSSFNGGSRFVGNIARN